MLGECRGNRTLSDLKIQGASGTGGCEHGENCVSVCVSVRQRRDFENLGSILCLGLT